MELSSIDLNKLHTFFSVAEHGGVTAAARRLALTPSAVSVAGAELTADGVRDQFGGLADGVLRAWTVCIARDLPAGITLTDLVVEGDRLRGSFAIDPAIVRDASLQQNGTCA